MLRSCSALLGYALIATATACTSVQSRPTYTVVHSIVARGDEFISVVVRPTIPDSELAAAATELHRLHPQSAITFYDSMNVPKIKLDEACFVETLDKLDSPSCSDAGTKFEDRGLKALEVPHVELRDVHVRRLCPTVPVNQDLMGAWQGRADKR